jgi:hypothetical protein
MRHAGPSSSFGSRPATWIATYRESRDIAATIGNAAVRLAPIPTFPRKRGKEQSAVRLPPPLAGEGWGGGNPAAAIGEAAARMDQTPEPDSIRRRPATTCVPG